MAGSIIRTELVLHGLIGMRDGYICQIWITTILGCPEQHLQINQVIHNRIMPTEHLHIARPRKDSAYTGIEQGSQ